jgi:6-phosphofructokinase 1
MARFKNVLVAQSGGPSPVINSSLQGVIEGCLDSPSTFGTVYGAWHGIEGVLKEELLDLSSQSPKEIRLLRTTPAAGSVGTCRYKLKPKQVQDFERVIEVFRAHEIGYLLYNGGNDSMDTANKVALLAREKGLELVAVGVPKTIDNDVGGGLSPDGETFEIIDHTPGYGSCARYWAWKIAQANQENMGSCPSDPVLVLQAMGRKIGFIPAAARLADPARKMPLLIVLVESGISLPQLHEKVNETLARHGRAMVVVSEGLDVGNKNFLRDSFNHAQYSTGTPAAEIVTQYLNQKGLKVQGAARFNVPGTDQRDDHSYLSDVDVQEAYQVGRHAVEIAAGVGSGFMATIRRTPGTSYQVAYEKVPLQQVANSERSFPKQWIAASGVDVTDDFLKYAQPLAGGNPVPVPVENGLPRFARLEMKFAEKKLKDYAPQAY